MNVKAGSDLTFTQVVAIKPGWQVAWRKSGLFTLFLLCAIVVFILGDNHQSTLPTNYNLYYEAGTTALFLVAVVGLRLLLRGKLNWPIAYAFFCAAAVRLVTTLTVGLREALFRDIGIVSGTNQQIGAGKVADLQWLTPCRDWK